jgi:transposase
VAAIAPGKRVYVDEAGVEDTLSYAYGWSEKGSRCRGERLGHRTQRTSIAAAWCQGQVLSPLMFQGYCNSAWIEAWFQQHLVKELQPGQVVIVVILDNAPFHCKKRLREILATVNCTLLPLPPYSPDLNKIEPLWNTLKSRIAHAPQQLTFQQKIECALCSL